MNLPIPDLSLAIPMYNEAACAQAVAEEVLHTLVDERRLDLELILVDNGSGDDTGAVLDRLAIHYPSIRVLHLMPNQGYGGAIIDGLAQAHGRTVGYVSGDGQVAPGDVWRAYEMLRRDSLDLCKALRTVRLDGWFRRVQSAVFNATVSLLFGCPASDINAPPKLMTRERYQELRLRSRNWVIDAEIMAKAHRRGWRVGSVETEYGERRGGKGKVNLRTTVELLAQLLALRFWRPGANSH